MFNLVNKMSNSRNWSTGILGIKDAITNSEKTIKLFEKSILEAEKKNKLAILKIETLENEFQSLNNKFIETNEISFFQAEEYFDNSHNPYIEFNLEAFMELKLINDEIQGEKFYITQREKIIQKDMKIIDDIKEWIKNHEEKINQIK